MSDKVLDLIKTKDEFRLVIGVIANAPNDVNDDELADMVEGMLEHYRGLPESN